MINDVGGRLRRSAWTLPLAAVGAAVLLLISESAYQRANDAVVGLGQRATARTEIQSVLRRLIDAETSQRGYLLTGRKEYLEPYEQSVNDVEKSLRWLTQYYVQDATTSALVKRIDTRSREKLSEVSTTIRLFAAGNQAGANELMLTDIGREKMDEIRTLANNVLDFETRLVQQERSELLVTLGLNRIGVSTMTALGLLALAMFLRQTRNFDGLQRQLAEALQAERDKLEADVVRRTADLTELAGHLQSAREDERSRLARELHDELGALLTAAKLDTARLKRSLGGPGAMPPDAEARLKHLNDTINDGIGLKRRIIEDLRPSSLSNLGLVAALEIQAREFAQRSEIKVDTELEEVSLAGACEITVFRLVQESLTNIAKYASASQVVVSLRREGARAWIEVQDNGRGFDTNAQRGTAHGLMGMRYRVEAAGGLMQVDSAVGRGTRVSAWVPALPEVRPEPAFAAEQTDLGMSTAAVPEVQGSSPNSPSKAVNES